MYENVNVPLDSIIIMERSVNNHIHQISFEEAFPNLLHAVYWPDGKDEKRIVVELINQFSHIVKFWHFQFNNFENDCFSVAYSALCPQPDIEH